MSTEYPILRFVTLHDMDGQTIPAYAPNAELDPAEAYAPFLHVSLSDAEREIAEDAESRKADLAGEGEEFLDDESSYWVVACTIHEDGTLTYDGGSLTRSEIFGVYGVPDPSTPQP